MSLRYRLFLLVSGLFVVVATCSFFMENYVTKKGLKEAQENMRAKILSLSEKRRIDLQEFLAAAIAEGEEKINAILINLLSFTPQMLRFGPTASNYQNGTWEEAADLLLEYKWLDFLQNTNQGKIAAAIIPQRKAMDQVYRIDIDDELSWVYDSSTPEPFIGVRIPYVLMTHMASDLTEIPETVSGMNPEPYLLFDMQDMMHPSNQDSAPVFKSEPEQSLPPIQVKWSEGYAIEITPIVKAFRRARQLLLSKAIQPPQFSREEILEKIDGKSAVNRGALSPIPVEAALPINSSEKMMQERLDRIAMTYTQISMIWALIAIYESRIFGDDLFRPPTPKAITLFSSNNKVGVGIEADDFLSSKQLFDDNTYFQSAALKNPAANIAPSIAVIQAPDSGQVYLGNAAKFIVRTADTEKIGYLTLGVNSDDLMQKLVFAVHQTAVLVSSGKVLNIYGEEGKRIELNTNDALPMAKMLSERSGIVPWKNENYFFMHMQPFSEVDLHFFLLNPQQAEFALLRDLQNGSKQVIDSILFDIHVAGVIALLVIILMLHNISRRITKPIVQLAGATKKVAEGHLDQIQLSLPPLKHNDEIAVLCHSFEEMIKGLKEKEKVKGVLNKVVSTEIAQEILKGSISLGGEEKKVTVLFADIREFTKMTQNMAPHEVVDLLNGCMTKVSSVIDKNGGVIDKFVGDEAMALFGAPIAREDAALKAVLSAVEIVEVLKKWNQERIFKGQTPIEMGIGIHTGLMLAGNMGAENRLNYTVIGSNVNLASRLCSAAKKMEILVTKDTLDEPLVKDRIVFEAISEMTFKGFDKPVEIFRVQGLKR